MSENRIFTAFHDKALAEAEAILKKHFDGYLLCVLVDDHVVGAESLTHVWGGGRTQAVGLATDFLNQQAEQRRKMAEGGE